MTSLNPPFLGYSEGPQTPKCLRAFRLAHYYQPFPQKPLVSSLRLNETSLNGVLREWPKYTKRPLAREAHSPHARYARMHPWRD